MNRDDVAKLFPEPTMAIDEHYIDQICLMWEAKQRGVDMQPRLIAENTAGVFVIRVVGPITRRPTLLSMMFGGVVLDDLSHQFESALASPSAGSVVFDFDSPGGGVHGVPEFADAIYQGSKVKRIVGIANAQAASAAYWLLSQCSEAVCTPSGEAGSIGVLGIHADESKALDKQGVKVTLVKAGQFKDELSPYSPLTESARAHMQARVDDYYDSFVKAVARGRRTSVKNVIDKFGGGRMLGSKAALAAGMVDRIATLDQVVDELAISAARPKISQQFGAGFYDFVESRSNRLISKL